MPNQEINKGVKLIGWLMDYFVTVTITVLKVILPIYDAVCFLPYLVMNRSPSKYIKSQKDKAIPIDQKNNNNSSVSYRSVNHLASLSVSPFPGICDTLDDLLNLGIRNHGNKKCYGTRKCFREIEQRQSNGKVFQKQILGHYEWMTFDEVDKKVDEIGRGLQALGARTYDKILIFAETRAEWMLAAQAAFRYNFSVVTLYATLGEEGIIHAINETEVKYIFTSIDLIHHFKEEGKMPSIKHIIYMAQPFTTKFKSSDYPKQFKIHSFNAICESGKIFKGPAIKKPVREDLAVILFTSGSTGPPKGVMISHGNLMCGMSGQIERITDLSSKDIYIGYLPLAHVLELACEISCSCYGVPIGYSSAHTLTDQSTKIIKGCKGDASELQPTLMAAVPAIMDRMYKVVWAKLDDSTLFQRELFKLMYQYKIKHRNNGLATPIVDRLIFQKIRNILGGHVRVMLSGGAPLSKETQCFMNVCFCCPVGQGYGLTETCGAGTVQETTDLSFGRVGSPLFCNQVKLIDWDEGNYTTRDKPYPRGEIVFGGGNIAMGYFKRDEDTARDFYTDSEGMRWFRSGDIGQWHDDGALEIIDRKKDLVKLQLGEYVALSKIETALKLCPLVDNVCVIANSLFNYVMCIVVPNDKSLLRFSSRYTNVINCNSCDSIGTQELVELCNNEQISKAVLHELQEYGKSSKLTSYEIPQRIHLCVEQWTPDNGLVTSTNKIKRRQIELHYAQEIEKIYR